MSMVAAEGAGAARAGATSRSKVLSDPRSGARPLGNSPGAGPGESRSPGPGPRSSPGSSGRDRASSAAAGPRTPEGRRRYAEKRQRELGHEPKREASGGKKKQGAGDLLGLKRSGSAAPYHNYQGIILAEFVAAEILVAASPMATRNRGAGLSPYVAKDLVQLVAIAVVYLVLELIASAGNQAGRFCAWFGGLVLLTVGLSEAANLAQIFAFITGGSGTPSSTISLTAAGPPTSLQQYMQGAPTLTTNETLATTGTAPGTPPPTGPGGTGPKSGSGFVAEVAKFIGTPYVWGGASPGGFDCSGLVYYALRQLGDMSVPRTSEEQWRWVQRISEAQLAPGDLIFEQWPGEVSPGHVAVYAGNGQIIQAPAPGQDVQQVSWSPSIVHGEGGQIVGYGRVPGLSY